VAAAITVRRLGAGRRREERLARQGSSDWTDTMRLRCSDDNGGTWSDWEMLAREWPSQGDCTTEQMPFAACFDPVSGQTVQMIFQRIFQGDPKHVLRTCWSGVKLYYDHGFCQTSADEGRTWGGLQQLKYEDGPSFDPDNWAEPGFLETNEMYGGYGLTPLRDGALLYPATVPLPYQDDEDAVVAHMANLTGREGHVDGVVCFRGRWDGQAGAYAWESSAPLLVPRRVSWRGLLEPAAAELANGDVLLVMRGSDTPVTPGRKWMAVSRDAGRSWSDVTDLRYDDGEQFYSPSSFARLLRSSQTGRLYFVGNISADPPDGNSPRYPLVIAEIDESATALKRDTVTTIDRYDPDRDTTRLQLSNFSLIEDPDTGNLELYLTRLGERGEDESSTPDFWTADAYKYTLAFA